MQITIIDQQQDQIRLAEITKALREAETKFTRLTVESMFTRGSLLIEAQSYVEEGQWERYVQEEIGYDIRTVQNYERVARFLNRGENFSLLVDHIPHVTSWYILASPTTPAAAADAVLGRALNGEVLSHKLVKEIVNNEKRREIELRAIQATAISIGEHGRGASSFARSLAEATLEAATLGAVEIEGEQFALSELLVEAAEHKTQERREQHIEDSYALNYEFTGTVRITNMHVVINPIEQGAALGKLMDFRDQNVQVIARKRKPQ